MKKNKRSGGIEYSICAVAFRYRGKLIKLRFVEKGTCSEVAAKIRDNVNNFERIYPQYKGSISITVDSST